MMIAVCNRVYNALVHCAVKSEVFSKEWSAVHDEVCSAMCSASCILVYGVMCSALQTPTRTVGWV